MTKRTLIIEGFPVYFGDEISWHEGQAVPALGSMKEKANIGRSVDIMGGIMDWDDLTFSLNDIDETVADLLRFYRQDRVNIVSPSPLTCPRNTDTVTQTLNLATTTGAVLASHPSAKVVQNSGSSAGLKLSKVAAWANLSRSWTVEYWMKTPSSGTTSKDFYVLTNWENAFGTGDGIRVFFNGGYFGVSINTNDNFASGTVTTDSTWVHVVLSWDDGTGTFYIDGALDSTFSDSNPVEYSGLVPELFNSTSSTAGGGFCLARLKVWKRTLTAAEALAAYQGKPVDDTSLLYSWDSGTGYLADVVQDMSEQGDSHILPAGLAFTGRELLPGDLLYLPYDTARVRVPYYDGSGDCDVQRQVYSCLENGWQSYYAKIPYPEAVSAGADNYVCQASTDGPWYYAGRLVAYYVDDVLAYLGRLVEVEQAGRRWTVTTTDILKPFKDGWKPYLGGLRMSAPWCLGYALCEIDDNGTVYTSGAVSLGMTDIYSMTPALNANYPNVFFNYNIGFGRFTSNAGSTLTDSELTKGTVDAFSENGGLQWNSYGQAVQMRIASRVPDYGICGAWETYITIASGSDVSTMLNDWLQVGKTFLQVFSVAGQVLGVRAYDEDLKPVSTWGTSSNAPILIQGAMVASASSLPELVWGLICSSGVGDNGVFDDLPGWLGLGLPHELVQADSYCPWMFPVVAKLEDAKLSDDLQALGQCLVFEDGTFKIKSLAAPILALASQDITDDLRAVGGYPAVKWGHFAPVSQISYKTTNNELVATAFLTSVMMVGDRRAKTFSTSIGAKLTAAHQAQWLDVTFRRLQWLSTYAPVIEVQLPEHDLKLLDVVTVSSSVIAGQGKKYAVSLVPGLVIGLSDDWMVQIALNLSPTANLAAWVPAFQIASYSGTSVTLASSEGTLWLSRWALPLTCQIIQSDGTVLTASVNITDISSSTQLTLSAAPTYVQTDTVGYITLPNYTSAVSTDQNAFSWVANTSGTMSDSDEGKKLS